MEEKTKMLEIKNLTIHYIMEDGVVHAVNNLNLSFISVYFSPDLKQLTCAVKLLTSY